MLGCLRGGRRFARGRKAATGEEDKSHLGIIRKRIVLLSGGAEEKAFFLFRQTNQYLTFNESVRGISDYPD